MKRRGVRTVITLLAVLAISISSQGWAFAQGPNPQFTATSLTPDSTFTASVAKAGTNGKSSGLTSVVVKLKGQSLATYEGGVPGIAATSPKVTGAKKVDVSSANSKAYLRYLAKLQGDFQASAQKALPSGKLTHKYDIILNAVSMVVPSDKVGDLAKLPNVEAIYPDQLLQINTDNSPEFIGAPTVWNADGGQESAGEGVIVGVLDTGIWPEHPSFSDPDPSGKPYAAPPAAPSGVARACDFSGGTNAGAPFTCNNKLIGAYAFLATYDAAKGLGPGEYTSARDDDGHGTHTSSTSAGNAGVAASIYGVSRGTVSGIAPRAQVIMYKVCGATGCFSSDSAAAVEQAVLDGVDVINFSISGGANPFSDPVEIAFLGAYDAGVFVAASAGNSGPTPETTDHRGPWVTTVAASTQDRAFENSVTLTADGGASLTLTGASITAGVGPAPVYLPSGSTAAIRCDVPLAPGSVTGKIVVCQRGNTGRAEKGYNVSLGGAAGMILYNQSAAVTDLETDNHYLPATHLQFVDGTTLLGFIAANTNVQATLTAGVKVAAQGDVMASFSSRGGPGQSLGVSKPDITAPGVQILAGASPAHLTPAQGGVALGPEGELFQAIAGTSMSSPHIAGSGALLKWLHPDWTPGQIKSALMTTASTSVVKENGVTPANAFDDGSGRVNLNKAGDPGVTFESSAAEYFSHQADLWNANYPSVYVPQMPGAITVQRTAHSDLSYTSVWKLTVVGQSASDFSVSVPATINVKAGKSQSFNIAIDAKDVPVGGVRMATLVLTESDGVGFRTLHMPITFVRKVAPVTIAKVCSPATIRLGGTTACTITAQNNSLSPASVKLTDNLPSQLRLVSGSVANGQGSANRKTVTASGTLAAAQPPTASIALSSSPSGYLPLSTFGIAPVAGVGDETISNFGVPAFTYGGQTYTTMGMVSNGYLVVGGGTADDVLYLNQGLPDSARPNNVIAPFWTDLNPGASGGGAMYVASLTDGVSSWVVYDWEGVQEYGSGKAESFQVWVPYASNADQTTFVDYGTLEGSGDGGYLTVGVENLFGNRGANYYYNGVGTLPTSSATELVVTSAPGAPGGTRSITYRATGFSVGNYVNYAELISNLFQGTAFGRFAGSVTP